MSAKILSPVRFSSWSLVAWVVITAIAVALGQMTSLLLSWEVGEGLEALYGQSAAILLTGLLIGIGVSGLAAAGQFLFLRGQVDGRRWIGGAVAGASLAMMLAFAAIAPVLESQPQWISGVVAGLALGVGAGGGQWLALRGRLSGINRWAVVCAASHAISIFLLFSLSGEGRELLALSSGSLAFGLLSALGARWAGLWKE